MRYLSIIDDVILNGVKNLLACFLEIWVRMLPSSA